MKLYLLYNPGTPGDRDIEALEDQLAARRIAPEKLDADSRDGIALAELYDVMGRPAVIAASDDGVLLKKWEGGLPSTDEISMYAPSA